MAKKIISISMTHELYEYLKREADKLSISVSAYIVLLLQKKV